MAERVTIDNANGDCPRCPGPDDWNFWAPFCDFCDDDSDGCEACGYFTIPNHNHDRWVIIDEQQRREHLQSILDLGITPW